MTVLETVFHSSLEKALGGVAKKNIAIGFVLWEESFEVGSVRVKDLPFSFFHSSLEIAYKAISIAMDYFGLTMQDASFPLSVDAYFSWEYRVGASSMP